MKSRDDPSQGHEVESSRHVLRIRCHRKNWIYTISLPYGEAAAPKSIFLSGLESKLGTAMH